MKVYIYDYEKLELMIQDLVAFVLSKNNDYIHVSESKDTTYAEEVKPIPGSTCPFFTTNPAAA